MNIIIHIGQSKTGTSALQSTLYNNRDLFKQNGVLYPDFISKGLPVGTLNHNAFADSLNGYSFYPHMTYGEYWSQFLDQAEKSKSNTILLSAESFYGGSPHPWHVESEESYYEAYTKKLETFSTLLKGHNVTVIGYLRSQNEWIESAIPQIIRYEGAMGKKVYHSDEQIIQVLKPFMNYQHIINLWDTIIAPKNLFIKGYNRDNFPEKNIFLDFIQHIDVDIDKFDTRVKSSDHANDTWSREYIYVKKQLNLTSKPRFKEDAIIEILNEINKNLDEKKKYQITGALHKVISNQHNEGNKKLISAYPEIASTLSLKRLEPYHKQVIQETNELSRDQAMTTFQEQYHSFSGRTLLFKKLSKRSLRIYFPSIYSFLAFLWKKVVF